MTDANDAAIALYRHRLDHLTAQGHALQRALGISPEGPTELGALRVWQRDCAAAISQLSGNSKAHWLSRAFSEALLVPEAPSESFTVLTIVGRLLLVLDRARTSIEQMGLVDAERVEDASAAAARARFAFVKDDALRTNLEHAYLDGEAAAARGEHALALVTFSSILEAAITDALTRSGLDRGGADDRSAYPISEWPFAARIEVAERARVISSGCARLPPLARDYRSLLDPTGDIAAPAAASARDATVARQVLHVILRDLAQPGR